MMSIVYMIKTFKDKDSKTLFEAEELKNVPKQFCQIARQAWRKLDILNSVPNLQVLKELLGKNYKPLKHDRTKGTNPIKLQAIKINDQYRVCFEWRKDNNAYEVEVNKHYWD